MCTRAGRSRDSAPKPSLPIPTTGVNRTPSSDRATTLAIPRPSPTGRRRRYASHHVPSTSWADGPPAQEPGRGSSGSRTTSASAQNRSTSGGRTATAGRGLDDTGQLRARDDDGVPVSTPPLFLFRDPGGPPDVRAPPTAPVRDRRGAQGGDHRAACSPRDTSGALPVAG